MESELFTQQELMTGLYARRASALLYLIEIRTSYLMLQSRQAMQRYLTEEAERDRDLAYLEAYSLERRPRPTPTIQTLEKYAPYWSSLVPDASNMRAALTYSLCRKYSFSKLAVPNIRKTLGLDTSTVQAAYQSLYHLPLENIYTPQIGLSQRLKWAFSVVGHWLETLPPFWMAFSLTLTETVGAGVLALPIAIAGVGPIPGIVLLILFGIINMLTVACIAEAVLRSGTIRYGSAYMGRMVRDYLGGVGALILSLGVFLICFLVLWAYCLGFATTLADTTHLRAEIWVVVLFLISLFFVQRKTLNATVASALLVGFINIVIIIILSLLALSHLKIENLVFNNLPFIQNRPFDSSLLGVIFGVVFSAYFGHLSVSTCARAVIQRDPGGRSLIWGAVSAQGVAMLIYILWVTAVNGAINPIELVDEVGTSLIPLTREVGVAAQILGLIFVLLGMGMASIHFSLGLFNLTREFLPARSKPVITLPRRQGRILLRQRRHNTLGLVVAVSYIGLREDGPHLLLEIQQNGSKRQVDVVIKERWDAGKLPELTRSGQRLMLEVVKVTRVNICLRLATSLKVNYEGNWDNTGMEWVDLFSMETEQQKLVAWLMRQRHASLSEISAYLGIREQSASELLEELENVGIVVETTRKGAIHYQVLLGATRRREATQKIWQKLEDEDKSTQKTESGLGGSYIDRILDVLLSERCRSILSLLPIIIVFLLAGWSVYTGSSSFSGLLGFIGVIVVPLLAGIFPVLLLVSSRKKGEYIPGVVYNILGNPVIVGVIYLVSLVGVFLHGLFIWQSVLERAGALFIGVVIVVVTIYMKSKGAFSRRMFTELRQDLRQGAKSIFSVMAGGSPMQSDVHLVYTQGIQQVSAASEEVKNFSTLRQVTYDLPGSVASELKVWAHRVTPEGESESLEGSLDIVIGDTEHQYDLKLAGGPVHLPVGDVACQVKINLKESKA